MPTIEQAKVQLDIVIRKARVHWYKPVQIAEILYRHRLSPDFNLHQLETYRARSRGWRDEVSNRLVGRASTSSARFQDNVFEENAVPPAALAVLAEANERSKPPGVVEAYIYASLSVRLGTLAGIVRYLDSATTSSFLLPKFVELFTMEPGLRRSIDKAYEIVVYVLFETIVKHLGATVKISVSGSKDRLLKDFEDFTAIVLGITASKPEIVKPASLYRVGTTNAADRGLDMWANFGPAVQVKHVCLSEELAGNIVGEVANNAKVIIVCETAEREVIENVLSQAGFSKRVQGVITSNDLERWYSKCLETVYEKTLGEDLLRRLREQFIAEFPSAGSALLDFQTERGYDRIKLEGLWQLF